MKFTKALKQAWLEALRSGKYIQGHSMLRALEGNHCCLGVLAEIHPKMSIGKSGTCLLVNGQHVDGYGPIQKMIGKDITSNLVITNDADCDGKYTTVIPLIEQIQTID